MLRVSVQGDDYILYCHPNRQKTPRSDRLREWYHMLLRSAKAEGTVTYLSNLFDTFFEGGKDHRVDKPSVLHLPYFEGAQLLLLDVAVCVTCCRCHCLYKKPHQLWQGLELEVANRALWACSFLAHVSISACTY